MLKHSWSSAVRECLLETPRSLGMAGNFPEEVLNVSGHFSWCLAKRFCRKLGAVRA